MDELEELLVKKYGVPAERAKDAARTVIAVGKAERGAVTANAGSLGIRMEEGDPFAADWENPSEVRRYPAIALQSEALHNVADNEVQRMRRLRNFASVYDPSQPKRQQAIEYGTTEAYKKHPALLYNYEMFMGKPDERRAALENEYRSIMGNTPTLQTAYEQMLSKGK